MPFRQGTLGQIYSKLSHDIKVPDIEVLMQKVFLIEKKLKYTKRKKNKGKNFYKLVEMRFNSLNLFIKA